MVSFSISSYLVSAEYTTVQSVLHVLDELHHVALTLSLADGESTLDAQYEHGEQQRLDNGHDHAALINSTQHVARQRVVVGVVVHEVRGIAQHEMKDADGQNEAAKDHEEC